MKVKILNTLIMSILFDINIGYTQDFWTQLGAPPNVVIYSLATSADGTLFIGTSLDSYGQGVYRLLPGSTDWVFMGLEYCRPYSMAVTSDGSILAGTEQIIYKSSDNGNSWYPVYESYYGNWLTIRVFDNGLVYAGDSRGHIINSLDNGETWIFKTGSFRIEKHIKDFAIGPNNILYTAIVDYQYGQGGVFRSENNGSNWDYIGLANECPTSVRVNLNGEVFACGNSDIYKYSGGGTSWISLFNASGLQRLCINPEGVIFATKKDPSFISGGVLFSQDNGQSFEFVNSGLVLNSAETLDMDETGYLYTVTNFSSSSASVFKSTQSTLITNLLGGLIQYSN
ncbi:MAG: hypothetical protein M0Q38_14710, partial [Bacteroidales bacterium]|nr:hypothetical protein [Bacteroidales bacterium]